MAGLAILGTFNFIRVVLLCFCAFRMSAPGLWISTILSIPYVAAHLALGFVALNTNADASSIWATLSVQTRTQLATELTCGPAHNAQTCVVNATSVRQQEIYIVTIWMIASSIIHFGNGITC